MAKQLIHHAASWKPTKLGNTLSREKEIDAALSVAWKAVIAGTWQVPLELAKAEILQYEFRHYRRKYQESGVISHEAKALEYDVNKLLGGRCDLTGKITENTKASNMEVEFGNLNNRPLGQGFGKSGILTNDMLSINHQNKEKLINNDTTFGQEEIGKRCNNQLGQGLAHVAVSEQNSSMCCGVIESENSITHQKRITR